MRAPRPGGGMAGDWADSPGLVQSQDNAIAK